MILDDNKAYIPKIAEIVVINNSHSDNWSFLRAVCDDCEMTDQNIILGQITVNEELCLYLYGISANDSFQEIAWDLILHKILGFVILFDWFKSDSFTKTLQLVDFLTSRVEAPMVVAADVHDRQFPIPAQFFSQGIQYSSQGRFIYCKSSDPDWTKTVLRILINTVINRLT